MSQNNFYQALAFGGNIVTHGYPNTCNYKPHYGKIVNLCVAFKSLQSTFSDIISSDAQNNPGREVLLTQPIL